MKFIHHFNKRVVCEMIVADTPPAAGQTHVLNIRWSARPKRKHLAEYIKWIHSVNEHLSSLWNIKITHCVQVAPRAWQCWHYQPGSPAEKIP